MDITRYLITQAVQTKDNELIPIWDERVTYGIVSEIEYCKCAHANMINALEGLDINCYACHKEVEGMRNGINPKEWEEWEKGRFSKKNKTQY